MLGASLAELGLRRATPLATAALVLGANMPDVDAITYFSTNDVSLGFRRGWTHGVLAMAVLPLVLTGVLLAFDRLVRRRRTPGAAPVRPRALLGLSYLAVLTHPALDWLNTYGVRLLAPFDFGWFYGDSLYIVDPFWWLLLGAPVALARSRGRLGAAFFLALAAALVWIVVDSDRPPAATKIAFVAGVVGLIGARLAGASGSERVARLSFTAALAYAGLMIGASRVAEAEGRTRMQALGVHPSETAALPSAGDPFARTVIGETERGHHAVEVRWIGAAAEPQFVPTHAEDEVVRAALRAPGVRGLAAWLRFPHYEVEVLADGYRVSIGDARRIGRSGRLGRRVVRLDAKLNVLDVESP